MTSSKQIEITREQLLASLANVRAKLARSEIRAANFDMSRVMYMNDCGTGGCIGGHCLLDLGLTYEKYVSSCPSLMTLTIGDERLYNLFFGFGDACRRKHAVQAIDAYFKGRSKNPWDTVRRALRKAKLAGAP